MTSVLAQFFSERYKQNKQNNYGKENRKSFLSEQRNQVYKPIISKLG